MLLRSRRFKGCSDSSNGQQPRSWRRPTPGCWMKRPFETSLFAWSTTLISEPGPSRQETRRRWSFPLPRHARSSMKSSRTPCLASQSERLRRGRLKRSSRRRDASRGSRAWTLGSPQPNPCLTAQYSALSTPLSTTRAVSSRARMGRQKTPKKRSLPTRMSSPMGPLSTQWYALPMRKILRTAGPSR